MVIKRHRDGFNQPVSSEITCAAVYRDRRDLMRLMAGGDAGGARAGAMSRR